jgi:ABC-type branched-subunit amino acid transport system substrate-binding protein
MALALLASACGRSSPKTATPSGSTAPPTAASGDFGSLKAVCGPGNAKGATDPGVTDTAISLATMSDPGFAGAPGLDQELFDSADAFVSWCNAAGGILGRKLTLHKRDAALTQVAARMIESCQQPDFMLVGNGEALDATGVQQRVSCHLPEISAYDVSVQAGTAPDTIEPNPNPNNQGNTGGYRALAKADPEAIKHYGMLSSTLASVKAAGNLNRATAEALGYTTVDYEELPSTVDNWRPIIENLKSHGVQVLTTESAAEPMVSMLKAMGDVGYFPKYIMFDYNMYDARLTTETGNVLNQMPAGGGVYISDYIIPFELADQYPATKQYVGLLNQYVHGAKPKALGINSFSGWLLFAEAAKACGSNLTRSCVMDHARATKDWTGAGLHAPAQPASAADSEGHLCFTLLKVSPSGFTVEKDITKPNSGIFNCSPSNSLKLPGFPPKS